MKKYFPNYNLMIYELCAFHNLDSKTILYHLDLHVITHL